MAATNQTWRERHNDLNCRVQLERNCQTAITNLQITFASVERKSEFGIYLKRRSGRLTEIQWALRGQTAGTILVCGNSEIEGIAGVLVAELQRLRQVFGGKQVAA